MRTLRLVLFALIPVVALLSVAVLVWGPERVARFGSDAAAVSVGGPFELVDQRGQPVSEKNLLGRYSLLYFGYTSCPDVCPTELNTVAQAIDLLPKATAEKILPVFVSVDPERDTPEVMREYVAAFHPRMVGYTGTEAQVEAMKKVYRVYSRKNEKDATGFYLVDHQSFIFLMGPDGRFVELFRPQLTPEDLAARLKKTVG